jgi:hypothetical protein
MGNIAVKSNPRVWRPNILKAFDRKKMPLKKIANLSQREFVKSLNISRKWVPWINQQ